MSLAANESERPKSGVKNLDYFNKGEGEKQKAFALKRDRLFRPIVSLLAKKGVTPTMISIIGGGLAACAVSMPVENWGLAAVGFFLYVFMDALDGPLARMTGSSSQGGSLIDIFTDQFGVFLVALGAIFWLGSSLVINILFAVFYSHTVYLMVICNLLTLRMPFILRVKYLYFIIYIVALYWQSSLPIDIFATIFLLYYLTYFVLLFRLVLKKPDDESHAQH
nr:CDP-alcohol phosphatidyltransferase family protein [uncultured Cohaesibacter sp.]